jgi:ribosomal protein S13
LALATLKIHTYVATGRAKHPVKTTHKVGGEMTQKMRQKLKRAGYRSRYRLRKQIVEPVFGQIKHENFDNSSCTALGQCRQSGR